MIPIRLEIEGLYSYRERQVIEFETLTAAGLFGIFGSVARNEMISDSDVDIIVDFDQPIGIGFIDLANFLEQQVNRSVDLVSKNGVKQPYFAAIEKEIIYV